MRVVSGLADLDFHIGHIARDGDCLVVESRAGGGIPTVVHVGRDDVVAGLRALLHSPGALGFLLTAPFRRSRPAASQPGSVPRNEASDINNPWR